MIPAQWKPAGGPTNSTLRSGPARSKRNREKDKPKQGPSQGEAAPRWSAGSPMCLLVGAC
jgi:hypothetical protein